ncbi:SUN domain-containing protein 3 isoform X2 [Zophobas morio]|uniref:SUN domain-containing protein 3 isoform X2 n=1 Tax=Zophobas morio TaxID=2755281 RepID=UPI0030827FB9
MSYTSITKTSEVSDSDSEECYPTRGHRYNTRYSSKNSNAEKSVSNKTSNKRNKAQNLNYNKSNRLENPPILDEDEPAMDYCFDPCPEPPRRKKRSSWCSYFLTSFYLLLIGGMFFVIYSQYVMDSEIKKLKGEVDKITGVHKKEDPHAKLSKELDKKCSDTLKLLLKDPVGRPDFALESSGGRVISVDTVPFSNPKTFLGFSICEGDHGPSSMIQATTSPGECWAFKGSNEHIPQTISPSGKIDTAPKDFKIWGLDQPNGNKRLLGQFKYESDASTVQTFHINNDSAYYKYVEFEVISNHGNPEFTCVYRLRVHGTAKNFS